MPDNSVHLVGNMTRDAELRFSNSGTAMASFGLAVNKRRKGVNGEYEDEAHFFDIQTFGDLAEHVAESLEKGARVAINGQLAQRSWETTDGDKRSKVEVVADSVAPDLRWATAQVTKVSKQ